MEHDTTTTPTRFGYELLRDHVIPDILGKHHDDILYWAGKEVARKFPVFSLDELPAFFIEAGWGQLNLLSPTKDGVDYELVDRLQSPASKDSFFLESGFLAEQYQISKGVLTECYGSRNEDTGQIMLQIRWDETFPLTK